jgi:indoleamine 2,3-dioxygenase
MYEKCDPHIFYLRIRPFLAGWERTGIVYEGVSETPLKLNGGSAAQSSLIQAFDAGLGIEHLHPETRPFLTLMRDYMPPLHRRFVEELAAGASLYDYVQRHQQETPALAQAFNACIDALDNIRKAHMQIAVRYILHQSPEGEKGGLGTGGTSFVPFLSRARKETIQRKVMGSKE